MNKLFRIAGAVALAAVWLSAVAEPKGPEYAVVTCAEDGTEFGGGKITLRDAVVAMADPAFTNAAGERVITFASGLTVKLTSSLVIGEGTPHFTIDGGADDAFVAIASDGGCRLIEHRGRGLTLRNLTLAGGAADGAGGAIYATGPASVTNQTLAVSNCTFFANSAQDGGAIATESNTVALVQSCTFCENVATNVAGAVRSAGRLTAVNCTIYGNQASGSGASALAVTAGGELLVAKCTVAAGIGAGGGLHVAAGATATVCDTFLLFNQPTKDAETTVDAVNDGALVLYGTGLTAAPTGGGTTTAGAGNDFSVDTEALVPSDFERLTVVNGVTNVVLAVVYGAALTNGAGVLWFDAAWTNVAVGTADAPVTALRGSAELATIRLANDQTGLEERPVRGALRHDFANVIRFQVDGKTEGTVEATCGSAEIPNAPAVYRVGGVLRGWYAQPGGAGALLWNAAGEPVKANLPKIPYEPLVVHALFESSDEAYTVNDGGDEDTAEDGKVTLRMLVAAMADHPEWAGEHGRRVITIPASVGTVTLASTLTVTNDTVPFVIRGAWDGTNAVTVKAQGTGYRLFSLRNAGVGFENLTFAGARVEGDGNGGGAILAEMSCALLVSNCAFRANGARGSGGAVRLKGEGTFLRCSFDGNTALLDNGHGGAVSAESFSPAVFRECSFTGNIAEGTGASGGAVYCLTPEGSVFESCTFSGNKATFGEGAVKFGSGGSATITGCLVTMNQPSSAVAAFTNLLAATLAEDGAVKEGVFGGAAHAFARPICTAAVTNAPGAAGGIDLLGRAALAPGLGAVRSEFGIRLNLDPGEGARVLDDVSFIWGVCGRSCVGLFVPPAQRQGATFLGWWTGPNRTGERCFDENCEPVATAVLPLAEQLTLHAGWRMSIDGLTVTTAKDTSGVAGQVSLRDAIARIAENAEDIGEGEDVEVTFELPDNAVIELTSPLEIPANVPPFVIDGSNGVTAVTLAASAAGLDAIVKANGRGLTLRNLMFAGESCGAAAVVSSNGALTVENCAFGADGCPVSAAGARLLLKDVSFANATTRLVCHARTNTLVNCTVLGTASPRLDCSGDTVLLKCTLPEANWTGSVTAVDVITNSTLVAETNVVTRCNGVGQVWRPVLAFDSQILFENTSEIKHDGDWSNIAVNQKAGGWRSVRGSLELATRQLTADQLGKTFAYDAHGAVRSRLAVRFDLNANGGTVAPTNAFAFCGEAPGPLPVPQRDRRRFVGWQDAGGNLSFGGDGKPVAGFKAPLAGSVTLTACWSVPPEVLVVGSEAEFQEALKALADPENTFPDRTITLTEDISLTQTLKIAEGTEPLTIEGNGKTIDGGGKVQIIDHWGKGLILQNLTLTGGDGINGGAVGANKGTVRAENCAFIDNCAPFGGALYLAASPNLLLNCTFSGNFGGSDGVGTIDVSPSSSLDSGPTVMIHCTVVERTSDAHTSHDAIRTTTGRLCLLACSFVGSGNTNHTGRLLHASGTGRPTLAGCAFARHPDAQRTDVGANDFSLMNVERCTFSKMGTEASSWSECHVTSVKNIFADWTDPKTRTVKGVAHVYYPPALTEQMANGIWVWHDSTWENIAYSTSPTWNPDAMRAVMGDPAACILLKSTDQIGLTFAPLANCRGSVVAIAANELGLEVTTTEDVVDPTDEQISLREAILAAESGQLDPGGDGRYTITFADSLFAASNAVTVAFDCTNGTGIVRPTVDIAIQGRTDGRSVALDIRNNQAARVFQIDPGVRFALRNLTVGYTCVKPGNVTGNGLVRSGGELEMTDCLFEKCRQWRSEPMVISDGGTAVAERCSFVGDPQANETDIVGGGTLNVHGGNMRVIDCTFADINLLYNEDGTWGVVEAMSSNGLRSKLAVVNCTFTGNRMGLGSVCACWAGTEVSVLNCIFNDNRNAAGAMRDVYVDSAWMRARGCVYSSMVRLGSGGVQTQALGAPEVDGTCQRETSADNIFAERQLRRILKDGVRRAYRPPKLFGPADRNGYYVWHDAAWTNVAITARYVSQNDKTNVIGTAKGLAKTLAGRYDVVCRDALEGINVQLGTSKDRRATMGSYTTPLDGETGELGELVVTTAEDDGTTDHDTYDGKLSLREAVDFANAHPHWRDTNGNCRVRFADSLFAKAQGQTFAGRMRQMEVTAFTNGTLSIVGPEGAGGMSGDMRSVTLDGQGRYRIFYVAPGNALALANLNFTNAVSQKVGLCQTYAGGAINSKGRLEVRNCAFRDCRTFQNASMLSGTSLGRAYGGAVCTEAGGTSVVERCTFVGCQATAGGAVCTVEGGDAVVAGSTFADNVAFSSGTVETGRGGAVSVHDGALRTVLVNCTLTRNYAQDVGGAIAAGQTRDETGRLTTALYLLDSIVLGNDAAIDMDTGDIRLDGKAKLAHCWLGRRNAGELDGQWTDDEVRTGKVPADVFGRYTTDGVALETSELSRGAWQTYFSLKDGFDTGAAFAWTYGGWANVGYATAKDGMRQQSVLYVRERNDEIRLKSRGEPMTVQQLGEQTLNRALLGAAEKYDSQEEPVPVEDVDPLCVTNGSFAAFCNALAYAATHTGDPSLISNGCLTITFAGNYTINVTSNLTLSAFTSPKLRIVGPVTFDGKSGGEPAFRPFLVTDGNSLVLENVTFTGCLAADGFGGAICLEGAELTASNVTFAACKANSKGDDMGFGGAVAALYGSTAVFRDCTFDGNAATDGRDVYRYESTATFVDSAFTGSADQRLRDEVVDWLNALVIRAEPAGQTYFSTVAEALAQCRKGDTLVLLNPNGPDEELVRRNLPPGVTLQVFTGENREAALSFVRTMADAANAAFEKDEPWYSATVREADGLVVMSVGLNEAARPGIGGDAQVDFSANGGAELSVWPTNVKPGLTYGLGRSETPEGRYVVEEDGWVRADANGQLPCALTAPKVGDACFYRVIVR